MTHIRHMCPFVRRGVDMKLRYSVYSANQCKSGRNFMSWTCTRQIHHLCSRVFSSCLNNNVLPIKPKRESPDIFIRNSRLSVNCNFLRLYSVFKHELLTAEDEEVVDKLFKGIIKQERGSLARGITLIESSHPRKLEQAQLLLSRILRYNKKQGDMVFNKPKSFRIGKHLISFIDLQRKD